MTTLEVKQDLPDRLAREAQATRGKFYKPGVVFRLPVYLDEQVQAYLATKAEAKGVELSDLVNDLLKREIEIIEAVR